MENEEVVRDIHAWLASCLTEPLGGPLPDVLVSVAADRVTRLGSGATGTAGSAQDPRIWLATVTLFFPAQADAPEGAGDVAVLIDEVVGRVLEAALVHMFGGPTFSWKGGGRVERHPRAPDGYPEAAEIHLEYHPSP